MSEPRRLPPVWVMGLTNGTWGIVGGFGVVTVPEMLTAQGVSGGSAAQLVATLLWSAVAVALLSPILDVRFSRRTYAVVSAVFSAAALMFTVLHRTNVVAVEVTMIAGFAVAALYQGAVGGWMGSLIPKEDDGKLGVWFAVSNIGAGGVAIVLGGELLRISPWLAALGLGALVLTPLLLFLWIPAPGPDRKLASESFGQFAADIAALVKKPAVVTALLMFALPSASFSLTNVLGGIGRDFSASERLVSVSAGVGSIAAGLLGSFALAPLARRFKLRPVYLGVGIAGALFTLVLLLLPRTPAVFAVAITGENLFQALAFATANAITFETIGPGNPLAATLFSVLIAISNLPIIYMGYVDGAGLKWRGVPGAFCLDAGLSMAACIVLLLALRPWRTGTSAARPA